MQITGMQTPNIAVRTQAMLVRSVSPDGLFEMLTFIQCVVTLFLWYNG